MRERRKWRRGKVSMKGFRNDPGGGGLGETALPGNATVGPCSESSKGMTYFNDMLGTTVGIWEGRASARPNSGRKYTAAALTAFGETIENESVRSTPTPSTYTSFFTGKPHVAGLGHVFLFRNYRASLAKWQTADPLGYPDGWNQLAYCNNGVTDAVDLWGCAEWRIVDEWDKPLSDGVWEELSRDAPSDGDILDFIARCSVGWVRLTKQNDDIAATPVFFRYERQTDSIWYKNEVCTHVFMRTTTYSITVTTKELKDDPSCWYALGELVKTFGGAIPGEIGKIIEAYNTVESTVKAFEELMDSIKQYGKDSVWTIPIGDVFYRKERQSSCGFLKVREE